MAADVVIEKDRWVEGKQLITYLLIRWNRLRKVYHINRILFALLYVSNHTHKPKTNKILYFLSLSSKSNMCIVGFVVLHAVIHKKGYIRDFNAEQCF